MAGAYNPMAYSGHSYPGYGNGFYGCQAGMPGSDMNMMQNGGTMPYPPNNTGMMAGSVNGMSNGTQQVAQVQGQGNMGTQMPMQQAQGGQIQMNPMQGISPQSRIVASKEEASANPADFSGAPIIMPMLVNGEVGAIYVKQWDTNRGQANFAEYFRAVPRQQQSMDMQNANTNGYYQPNNGNNDIVETGGFVSTQDFQNLQEFAENLQDVVKQLQNEVDKMKKPQVSGINVNVGNAKSNTRKKEAKEDDA